jgi:hypothetical protein
MVHAGQEKRVVRVIGASCAGGMRFDAKSLAVEYQAIGY